MRENNIESIINSVPEWIGKSYTIKSMNHGMTNRNYKVIVDNDSFFLSIPSPDSNLLKIDYTNKYYNNNICGAIGISPKVVCYIKSERILVTKFIKNTSLLIRPFQDSDRLSELVKMIKLLHDANPFFRDFNMFSYINHFMRTLKNSDISKLLSPIGNNIKILGQKLDLYRKHLVPCHNDIIAENIIDNGKQLFLIDFDYSGNNDPCFELGNLSVEMGYNDNQVNELVNNYFGQIQEHIISRVYLQSIASDLGWSLWGFVQDKISNLNYDFKQYAIKRLERVMSKIESVEYELWLKNI